MSEIEKALIKKIKRLVPKQSFIGKVVKVDESKCFCAVMPIDSDVEVFKVRLKPTVDTNKKGIIAIPAIDSYVIVALLGNNENSAYVVWCSNIKKYTIIGDGGNTFELTDDGKILINGDDYEGLTKVAELTKKLNVLEDTVNQHLKTFNTHIHTGGIISGSTGAVTIPDVQTIVRTKQSEIENTKVKHGKGN